MELKKACRKSKSPQKTQRQHSRSRSPCNERDNSRSRTRSRSPSPVSELTPESPTLPTLTQEDAPCTQEEAPSTQEDIECALIGKLDSSTKIMQKLKDAGAVYERAYTSSLHDILRHFAKIVIHAFKDCICVEDAKHMEALVQIAQNWSSGNIIDCFQQVFCLVVLKNDQNINRIVIMLL